MSGNFPTRFHASVDAIVYSTCVQGLPNVRRMIAVASPNGILIILGLGVGFGRQTVVTARK